MSVKEITTTGRGIKKRYCNVCGFTWSVKPFQTKYKDIKYDSDLCYFCELQKLKSR